MNELSKLFSSVLLLGAGFAAASLFSPPEVIERLASLARPAAPTGATLQPLASDAPPLDAQGWPALPAQPPQAESSAAAGEPVWGAPVAPSVQRASWPGPAEPDEAIDPTRPRSETPQRALKPIPRAIEPPPEATAAPVAGDSFANEPADWSAFAAPQPERLSPRSLEDNPYGHRPSQPAAVATDAFPSLRRRESLTGRPEPAGHQSHIVTDGDTLESLAERYFGDPARAGELFEMNDDRLTRPDLLPIGMVLRTPQRRPSLRADPPRRSSATATPDAPSAFATVSSAGDSPFARPGQASRPLTPIVRTGEEPLSAAAVAGPVDPWYAREVMWDENQW